MRLIKILSILISLTAIVIGCKKKSLDSDFVNYSWKVKSLKSDKSIFKSRIDESLLLSFPDEDSYRADIGVNICSGQIIIPNDGKLNFQGGCTLICCDSEDGELYREILSSADSYFMKGDQLTILGPDGSISFEQIE